MRRLTQLLVILANMIAHVGNFDRRRPIGGSSAVDVGGSVLPAWIDVSSDLVIKGLSLGSLVTL